MSHLLAKRHVWVIGHCKTPGGAAEVRQVAVVYCRARIRVVGPVAGLPVDGDVDRVVLTAPIGQTKHEFLVVVAQNADGQSLK